MSLITEANLGELTSLEELVRILLWKKNLHDHGLLKAFFIIYSIINRIKFRLISGTLSSLFY